MVSRLSKQTKGEREQEKKNLWDVHERALEAELEEVERLNELSAKRNDEEYKKNKVDVKPVYSTDKDLARVYKAGAQYRVFIVDSGLQTAFADVKDAKERANDLCLAMHASEENLPGKDEDRDDKRKLDK